jgi:hypothetical protein
VPILKRLPDATFARHLRTVAKAMLRGDVVPVLGAGANLCDRQPDEGWIRGTNLPSGAELARWLADEFECDVPDPSDLVRVSQYADITEGEGPLYQRLREVFLEQCGIPSLHRFLAGLPKWMADNGRTPRPQLIVSTNYDDLVELALREADVEFDLVSYVTNGPNQGRFVHERPDGTEQVITQPNAYVDVDPEQRTVLLKIHGSVDRADRRQDSYVITEDHYIEYLTRTNPSELIPAKLLEKIVNSHQLFLGYGLRDWNLRVMLHQILALRDLGWKSWAVQAKVDRFDGELWSKRDVELLEHQLSDYVSGLRIALEDIVALTRV